MVRIPLCPDRADCRSIPAVPLTRARDRTEAKGLVMAKREPRNRVVRLRLSETEWLLLSAVCIEKRSTMSAILRRAARAAGGLGPSFEGTTRRAIVEQSRQLRAIGVNLNQIARVLNAGKVPPDAQIQKVINPLIAAVTDTQNAYLSLCDSAKARVFDPAAAVAISATGDERLGLAG